MYFIWEVWKLGSKVKKEASSGDKETHKKDPFK
jgi:hypothetical protein